MGLREAPTKAADRAEYYRRRAEECQILGDNARHARATFYELGDVYEKLAGQMEAIASSEAETARSPIYQVPVTDPKPENAVPPKSRSQD